MDLGQVEASDYQRRLTNLEQAQSGMIAEGDKVFQDQARRFGNQVQLQGAMAENRQNTWGDISNMGFGLADFGLSGGWDKIMQGMGNNNTWGGFVKDPMQSIDRQGLSQAMSNLPSVGPYKAPSLLSQRKPSETLPYQSGIGFGWQNWLNSRNPG
jgi:hypothetical protein